MSFVKRIETVLNEALEYVFMLLLILTCNSFYNRMPDSPNLFTAFLYLSLMGIFLLNYKSIRKSAFCIHHKKFILFYVFCLVLVRFFVTDSDYSRQLVVYGQFGLLLPLIVFIAIDYMKNKRLYPFLEKFVNFTVFLSVSSVVLFALASLGMIKPTFHPVVDWGGTFERNVYYGLLFETTGHLGKNLSIFCEPPMFNLILILALLIELCLYPALNEENTISKKQWIRVLIILVAVITSQSITGYLLSILLFLLKGFHWLNVNKNRISQKYLFGIITLLLIGVTVGVLVFIGKSSSNSWAIRVDDYYATFFAWMESPVFGNGYGNIESVYPYMSLFRMDNMGLANSIGWALVQGGIPYFLLYFLPPVLVMKRYYRNSFDVFLFAGIFFTDLLFTIFLDNSICFLYLGILIAYIVKDASDLRETEDEKPADHTGIYLVLLIILIAYYTCQGVDSGVCKVLSVLCSFPIPAYIILCASDYHILRINKTTYKDHFTAFLKNLYTLGIILYVVSLFFYSVQGKDIYSLSFVYLSENTIGSIANEGILKHLIIFWMIWTAVIVQRRIHMPVKYQFVILVLLILALQVLDGYYISLRLLSYFLLIWAYLLIGDNWENINRLLCQRLTLFIHILLCACGAGMMYLGFHYPIGILSAMNRIIWPVLVLSLIYREKHVIPLGISFRELTQGIMGIPLFIYCLYEFALGNVHRGYLFILLFAYTVLISYVYILKRKKA